MPKRLIVCCDGTWNRRDQAAPTNVSKLEQAIDDADGAAVVQQVHYEPGVGTAWGERISGGAFGIGLSRNVRRCYRFVIEHYEDGDELFFFGFSRGAFTARSLAGLVRNSGILRREHEDLVDEAYRLYRSRKPENRPRERAATAFRRAHSHPDPAITFIGVWDTVGALGIPIDGFRPPLLTRLWRFHDTTLSSAVQHAYHAVSIDERRRPFRPTLWVRKIEDGMVKDPPPGQVVQQVWFAGVHSDVGGGARDDPSLSEIPLLWIVDRARACGLVLKPNRLRADLGDDDAFKRNQGIVLRPDPLGTRHDSMTLAYRMFKPFDRRLRAQEGIPVNAFLASSVDVLAGAQAEYRPPGLQEWRDAGGTSTDVPGARRT